MGLSSIRKIAVMLTALAAVCLLSTSNTTACDKCKQKKAHYGYGYDYGGGYGYAGYGYGNYGYGYGGNGYSSYHGNPNGYENRPFPGTPYAFGTRRPLGYMYGQYPAAPPVNRFGYPGYHNPQGNYGYQGPQGYQAPYPQPNQNMAAIPPSPEMGPVPPTPDMGDSPPVVQGDPSIPLHGGRNSVLPRNHRYQQLPVIAPPPGTLGRTYTVETRPIPVDKHPRVAMAEITTPEGFQEEELAKDARYKIVLAVQDVAGHYEELDGYLGTDNIWHFETDPLYPDIPQIYEVRAYLVRVDTRIEMKYGREVEHKTETKMKTLDWRRFRMVMGRIVELTF